MRTAPSHFRTRVGKGAGRATLGASPQRLAQETELDRAAAGSAAAGGTAAHLGHASHVLAFSDHG